MCAVITRPRPVGVALGEGLDQLLVLAHRLHQLVGAKVHRGAADERLIDVPASKRA